MERQIYGNCPSFDAAIGYCIPIDPYPFRDRQNYFDAMVDID